MLLFEFFIGSTYLCSLVTIAIIFYFCYSMDYCGYIKFVCQYIPVIFMRNSKYNNSDLVCLLVSCFLYYLSCFLKYSIFFKTFTLIDMGGYDLAQIESFKNAGSYVATLWYIFKDLLGCRLFLFVWQYGLSGIDSIEVLFRNARWLEREAAEFYGIFFYNKCDRRVLYTLPLFYNAPFKRKFPSVGYYELLFCPLIKKLRFRHLSVQA